MKKIQILKIVNILLFLGFLLVIISMLLYRFIPGDLNGTESMANLHAYSGLTFVLLAIIHVILNFSWIKQNYLKKNKKKEKK